MFKTPILLLLFNRPETSVQVVQHVAKVKPAQIYIATDGPRLHKSKELELCQKTIATVLDSITWSCEVKTLFRTENLGCQQAVSQAITWFFSQVEEGIILEDDVIAGESFFSYCEELLIRYRNSPEVMEISGFNHRDFKDKYTYYFSHYNRIWGWATWRRAWQKFDFDMQGADTFEGKHIFKNQIEKKFWTDAHRNIKTGEINSWAYRWKYSIWKNKGVAIVPNKSLTYNIGFSEAATHTEEKPNFIKINHFRTITEIKHPKKIIVSRSKDLRTFYEVYLFLDTWQLKLRYQITSRIPQPLKIQVKKIITRIKKIFSK
ncbi:MAG: nucleotide-diphospho-sugar transferase [Bernardetiaceae bacterium]|nr:nucleotide-diphospho-sugar transferase [Bernardetiaceae bacterium]